MPKRTCVECGRIDNLKARIRSSKCMSCARNTPRPYRWTKVKTRYTMNVDENGKRIYRHRLVMEQHLQRKLFSHEVVHHIDGDRHNNDISNLELLSCQSEHNGLHEIPRDPITGRFLKKA